MKITFLGVFKDRIKYNVELNGYDFDFYTGIGWAYVGTKKKNERDIPAQNYSEALGLNRFKSSDRVYIEFPSDNDILECLQSDFEAGQMSFSEFCDNFGYSNDSLSALDIYRKCEDTAKKLRGYKFPEVNND